MATNNAINNSVKVTTYTSSDTWTKDSRTLFVKVIGWGGGGGGGSGRQGASTAAGGGGGGAFGGTFSFWAPQVFFNSTETVTIGSGGTGGATQGSNLTNGNNGNDGGQTSFGRIYTLGDTNTTATNFGAGGTTTTATGGVSKCVFSNVYSAPGYFASANQGKGNSGAGLSFPDIDLSSYFRFTFQGTGAGGGAGANLVTAQTGGNGSQIISYDASTILLTAGVGGVETGTINGTNGTDAPTSGGNMFGGSGGGGGGGQKTGLVAGTGGNGGVPGGGGGGGGGSISLTTSGAGGNGARGQITVIEYF